MLAAHRVLHNPAGATYDSVILGDSPVSFWKLNESSGTSAADSAGSNTGTYTGGFTLGQAGIGDGETAVAFNGSTGYVSVPNSVSIQLGDGPLSLEAWIKLATLTQTGGVFGWNGSNDFELRVDTSGTLHLLKQQSASIVSATTTISDTTTFHHVVCTKNGTAVHLYLDGTDVTGTVTNSTLLSQTNALGIGTALSAVEFFNGTVAKAAIYNKVLTPTQVSAHFAAR